MKNLFNQILKNWTTYSTEPYSMGNNVIIVNCLFSMISWGEGIYERKEMLPPYFDILFLNPVFYKSLTQLKHECNLETTS